ncbi:ATP-binding protein [Aquimarina sp. 2-A2]|uniref:ATP-binding protein n=1 Tax=Aquimarina sp. 2-A2 TaxID=3382644 RepID=UPI00387F0294
MTSPSALYPKKVDLTNCDKEPIHILGKVQDHGILLGFDSETLKLTYFSSNAKEFLKEGLSDPAVVALNSILEDTIVTRIIQNTDNNKVVPLQVTVNSLPYICIAHKNENYLIVEFEPIGDSIDQIYYQQQMTDIITELGSAETDLDMCNSAAHLIKDFLGYDRVMLYKFDADWNGEVVSEAKEDELESWLGLNYPATDIPQQARKLFLKQGVRIIADVDSEPASLESLNVKDPLDLSRAELRAVSSIHIEYLKNMKVGATLTAAIIFNNTLWGLIACHHYSPKFINFQQRLSCKFLTQVFSTQLALKSSNAQLHKINNAGATRNKLVEQMSENWNVANGLSEHELTMLDLTEASGGAILVDGKCILLGTTIEEAEVKALNSWILKNRPNGEMFYTNKLSTVYPDAGKYAALVSGVLHVSVSKNNNPCLLWFKAEQEQTVDWAGNPDKPVQVDKNARLSPRKSFEKWTETVSGVSQPWKDYEIAAADALRNNIATIIIQKYDEVRSLNDELKRAYKELEAYSYSISHDLRAPLRGIDGFAQIIKEDYFEKLDEFGQSAIHTIIDSTNKMNELIDDILSFSGMSQQKASYQNFSMELLIDKVVNFQHVKVSYPNTVIDVQDDIPDVYGDSSMLFQMLNNLVGNALKYSAKSKEPLVTIGFSEKEQAYFVQDNGIGFDAKHSKKIFGVFNRLVGNEYQGSGIGLAIVKRAIEKHNGKIWAVSEKDKGSIFYFKLNKEVKK